MACTCSHESAPQKPNSKFRTALWIALFINLAMFFVELIGGAYTHSSALWADSLDFFGDAVNYGISLAVLGASLYWRATVALLKGITMALFGFVVITKTAYAYGNVTVILAAIGVFRIGSLLPDVIVALIMATLGLTGGYQVITRAFKEPREQRKTMQQI